MAGLTGLFRQTNSQRAAADALQRSEDKLMAVHPLERTDLNFHCDAEGERGSVLINRIRALQADNTTRSDRNFYALLIIGGLLMFKGVFTFSDLMHLLASLVGAG